MKYLFLVAHIDDAELSCGGTIAKLIEQKHFVHVISFTEFYNEVSLYDEFESSMKTLGVEFYQTYNIQTRELNQAANEIADLARYWAKGFDYVFTHSENDRHSDHKTVSEQVRRVVNGSLITFMSPCNGTLDANMFVELSEDHLKKKMEAISKYESQKDRHYMQPRFINAQAIYDGAKCGKRYAESFKILRKLE